MDEGSQTLAQRGGLPGLERLGESLGEIIEESELMNFEDVDPTSSLPFGVGGDTSEQITSLPFGIGSNPSVAHDSEATQLVEEEISETTKTESVDSVQPSDQEQITEQTGPIKVTATLVESPAIAEDSKPIKVSATTTDTSTSTRYTEVDMEQIYAEEQDVVHHDFSNETGASEIMVNLDDIAEPVSASMVFSPEGERDVSEPDLFPVQALELNENQGAEEVDLSTRGFSAMANSQWDDAAIFFQRLAKMHPTNARIMNNYGLALLQRAISMQGDDHFSLIDGADTQFEAAIMALRQAAHTDPHETTILYNLGNALASSGRYDKALRIYNAFLERSPATSGVLNGRAAAYIGLGRFDEATKDLREAVTQFGDHPVTSANLRRLTPA